MPRFASILLVALLLTAVLGCKSSQHAGSKMTATAAAGGGGATVPVELDDYVIRMPETIPVSYTHLTLPTILRV